MHLKPKREERENLGRSFLKPSFEGLFFDCLGFYKSRENILLCHVCNHRFKERLQFLCRIYINVITRRKKREEIYNNDREGRKRGRSGRHRGGTVHYFYFFTVLVLVVVLRGF